MGDGNAAIPHFSIFVCFHERKEAPLGQKAKARLWIEKN